MARQGSRRQFGQITRLPSGRYRARYADPDGRLAALPATAAPGRKPEPLRHSAPTTFDTREDAEAWLTDERRLISAGTWTSPADRAAARRAKPPTLAEYAPRWLATRKVRNRPLADRTRNHYDDLLERFILPTLGEVPMRDITPELVASWYDTTAPNTPTYQAHAYGLLKSILTTAADPTKHNGRPLIPFNPCGIVGGGAAERVKKIKPPTSVEVATIAAAMPERHRLMVLLADGCALRFGELAELRRTDVSTGQGVIHVRRGVVRVRETNQVTGQVSTVRKVKAPKSAAGLRDVPIPPHLVPAVREHLLAHTAAGAQGLLFPGRTGEHLSTSAFYGKAATLSADGTILRSGWGWYEARRVAGRTDLRFHDLRHGALTDAARHGATLAELMALAGHSTSQAAQRYQHASSERLQELARRRSEATGWTQEGNA